VIEEVGEAEPIDAAPLTLTTSVGDQGQCSPSPSKLTQYIDRSRGELDCVQTSVGVEARDPVRKGRAIYGQGLQGTTNELE
jgi:hypothetical protein